MPNLGRKIQKRFTWSLVTSKVEDISWISSQDLIILARDEPRI